MKKLAIVLLLFSLTMSFAQTGSKHVELDKPTKVKVHAVSYTANSIKELETIDWNSMKEVFEYNNETEIIKMSFGIDLKESKNNFKSSIAVSGETKNIDSLIIKAKKGVNAIMKISEKH